MKPLPQSYNHKETEKKWQQNWYESGVYHWDEEQPRENTYVIDTPPPTVSGLLHMGHIFSYTQADFVARYQRMSGKTVFYPMGFDDNGLPTERLVEKVKKIRATDMSREKFIEECESVAAEARKEFRTLFESVALSVDWRQEYHTISEESRKISQMSFLDLYNKGQVERKLQPMLWDPVDQTAIAQAEVEDKEMPGQRNYLHFGLVDEAGKDLGKIEIMTTRPELLGACVAVICHSDDAAKYKGKMAVTPVFGVKVPIVADDKVDKEKGTGLVMCCTFGDETDIAWWREHKLATRIILNKYGKIDHVNVIAELKENDCLDKNKAIAAFEQIQNLKSRTTAREKMLELLAEAGAIYKEPEKMVHPEPCAERSGSPLELLPTHQWFVKVLDKKDALKKKSDECTWYPEYMKVRMNQWIDGLSWDWCISRQRYFGVPFPVWYVESLDNINHYATIVARAEDLPVNPLIDLPYGFEHHPNDGHLLDNEPTYYERDGFIFAKAKQDIVDNKGNIIFKSGEDVKITPEADVMDTWATSSVSPQLSSKGISKELAVDSARHAKLFPADLRPQAHEIIRTWAFYTLVKAHLHENTIPWKNLMISGWCLAADKTKMSKSKGNVVTPVDLIENKGADVVRYWASTSRLGADTAYSEDVLKIGHKLVNKIWNATKFAAIHLDKLEKKPTTAKGDVESGIISAPLDLWILTRLARTVKKATEEFDRYEYSNARSAIEDFFWNDFCDNYLELVKVRVYGEGAGMQSAACTIYHALDAILRLFAPIVPHITEELYTHIFDDKLEAIGGSVHARGSWPDANNYPLKENEEKAGISCVSILNSIRKMKAERNVSVKWPLNFIAISTDGAEKAIGSLADDLKNVTNAKEIIFSDKKAEEGFGLQQQTDDGAFTVIAEFAKDSESNAA